MIMEDGRIVNETESLTNRQVALLAAASSDVVGAKSVLAMAEEYLKWLEKA